MILVMLSGGLDSTAMLVKLLQETNEPIHVHHVILRNVEKRWMAENVATGNIVNYCRKNYRDFKYTANVFGFTQFDSFFGWDNDIVRFIAAQICKGNPLITELALGKCKDDVSQTFRVRALQSATIWRACFLDGIGKPPEIIRPVENMTKKQLVEYLSPELFKMTWSCRTPKKERGQLVRCEICDTCKIFIEQGL